MPIFIIECTIQWLVNYIMYIYMYVSGRPFVLKIKFKIHICFLDNNWMPFMLRCLRKSKISVYFFL